MENTEASIEMDGELYNTAMRGNVECLDKHGDEYILRKTHHKNNILHIAIQYEQLELIKAIIKRFSKKLELVCDKNSRESSPLHTAAEVGNIDVAKAVFDHSEKLTQGSDAEKPWMIKSFKGNTVAHVALIHGNANVALFLVNKFPDLAFIVNDSNESLLHLAIKHHPNHSKTESLQAKLKKGEFTSAINLVGGEVMSIVIKVLVEKASYVTCWHDANGLTPLHRAALLSVPEKLEIIKKIMRHCPQSAEEYDNCGNSILHLCISRMSNYQQGKYLLNLVPIRNMKNCQNHQGNTPLHIAGTNKDADMVHVLLRSGANPDIINMEGIAGTSLIEQNKLIEMVENRRMTEEEIEAADRGDIGYLQRRTRALGRNFFRSRDSNGKNLLHKLCNNVEIVIADRDNFYEFIRLVVTNHPKLIGQVEDLHGDTPIHVLVRRNNVSYHPQNLVHIIKTAVDAVENHYGYGVVDYDPPWTVQNVEGNTPLHESLISRPRDRANVTGHYLLAYDKRVVCLANNRGETPFHLLGDETGSILYIMKSVVYEMRGERDYWMDIQDVDGMTPIMRALQGGWESTAKALLTKRNPFPLPHEYTKGNTAMHMAIQNKQFDFIRELLSVHQHHMYYYYLFEAPNRDRETAADLIGELDTIPSYLDEIIEKDPKLRGIRSTWGIPKSQLQNYMSSMNVIAALLTTITFTAAFAVPGGLNSEKGTPVLMESKAFQVFLVSDVIAMCLSMMVLFRLLWMVATDKRTSVMIQDFAVSLLLASFVATLLTFMAGVYAIIFPVNPSIAISTLVLCSLLLLLVHKLILTNLILPSKNATINFFHLSKTKISKMFTTRETSPKTPAPDPEPTDNTRPLQEPELELQLEPTIDLIHSN